MEEFNINFQNSEVCGVDSENDPTTVGLANCTCPYTTSQVPFDAATDCRIINIPVRISHLCPNKEFLLFVTVLDTSGNRIGQICSVFTGNNASCNVDYVQNVRIAIKKPVCSTDNIVVRVTGNYTSICDL